MRAVIQRVSEACVKVNGETVGEIKKGFLVLLGVGVNDTKEQADYISAKIAGLRKKKKKNDKMNLSLADVGGEVLVISNFNFCFTIRTSFLIF